MTRPPVNYKPSEAQVHLLLRLYRTHIPLIRLHGGFWTAPGTPLRAAPLDSPQIGVEGVPTWHYAPGTVKALLHRGFLQSVTRTKYGPSKVELSEAGRALAAKLAGPEIIDRHAVG